MGEKNLGGDLCKKSEITPPPSVSDGCRRLVTEYYLKYLGIRHISPQNVASIVTTVVITKLTFIKKWIIASISQVKKRHHVYHGFNVILMRHRSDRLCSLFSQCLLIRKDRFEKMKIELR